MGIINAVMKVLPQLLARLENRRQRPPLSEELRAIGERVAAMPVQDLRGPEEILGYDEHGLPR